MEKKIKLPKKYKKILKAFKLLSNLKCIKFSMVCVDISGEEKWFLKEDMSGYKEYEVSIEFTPKNHKPIIYHSDLKLWDDTTDKKSEN